jgi:hypothetical protein
MECAIRTVPPAAWPEPLLFIPTPLDAIQTRVLFQRRLPVKVVHMIIDEAEYWPCIEASTEVQEYVCQDQDTECVRTPPLCWNTDYPEPAATAVASERWTGCRLLPHRSQHPVRKIVFSISSHDQGWGGETGCRGTYYGSWSWFDAYIVSSNDEHTSGDNTIASSSSDDHHDNNTRDPAGTHDRLAILPNSNTLQVNRVATHETAHHRIVWHFRDSSPQSSNDDRSIVPQTGRGRATMDGRMVRNMSVGDQVVVWAVV